MRNNECEKTDNIVEPILNDSDDIVYWLIGLLGLSALIILWPLICAFFAHKSSLVKIYGIRLEFLYEISLGIQLLVIFVVIVFSICFRKTWGKKLSTGKMETSLEEEKKIMEICEYTSSDEVGWIKAKKISNNALSEFKFCWTLIWFSWIFLYMVIQAIFPTYLNYRENLAINVLICITTLVCKIILFLFVFEQIKSGRLLFYFIRIRKLHYDFDEKWNQFLRLPQIARNKGASKNAKKK